MNFLDELKQTKTILMLIVIIIASIAAGVAWYQGEHPKTISKTEFVNVPQIKTVTKIKTVMVPITQVETISKPEIVAKLKLDDTISKNPDKQITATGVIAPYEGKTDVLSILNTKTGHSDIVAKQEPLSFFSFENKPEIGVRYGTSIKNGQEGDVYGRWDFLRVGKLHIGAYAEATSYGEAKAMVSVGYKW